MAKHQYSNALRSDPEKGSSIWTPVPVRKSLRNWTTNTFGAKEPVESTPARRLRRDILLRKGHHFAFDEDDIFRTTQDHVEYTHNGTTLKGLQKYWDCTDYGITESSERHLLQLEVHRIVEAAKSEDDMLLDVSQHLAKATDTAFAEIAHIADQIQCSSEIIRLDAARVSLEHCNSGMENTVEVFRNARRRLRGRFAQEDTGVQGSEPKYLSPPARNQGVYFAIVDYMTASVARLIVRTAWSKWSNRQLLSILSIWSTKLKVLSYEPAKFAKYSIETAEHTVEQLGQSSASKQALVLKIRLKPDAQAEDVDTLDTETDVSGRYHEEKTFFNAHIRGLLKVILVDLGDVNEIQRSVGSFETCALVYKAGLDGTLTTVSCDRTGDISASSDPFRLKCSSTALELVKTNVAKLRALVGTSTSSSASVTGPQTRLRLEWSDSEDSKARQEYSIMTGDINHIFSVVVPLSLASTFASNVLDDMIGVLVSGATDDDPILQFEPPNRGFSALVAVSTSNWIARERSLGHLQRRDEDVRTLPQSPLGRTIRASTNNFRAITNGDPLLPQTTHNFDPKQLARYEAERNEMDHWVIAESSVTIKCVSYVRFVMITTMAIVCGGMSIPFIVGQRIRGVDPFQLTTFAWFFAGFVAIFAKSRYVSEWPWHDFLHGRVVCTSISDVVDVTRLKPQTVLTYLLLEEQTTTLRTAGPYNGMFLRQTEDSSGFAIDEAADTFTMLASGFVLLKVLNESGEHIICLDVRKGTKGRAPITHSTREYLACMNLEEYEDPRGGGGIQVGKEGRGGGRRGGGRFQWTGRGRRTVKVKKLAKSKFAINRVLGVYVGHSRFG